MPIVTAIIPVYNVAPFAGRCARALMEQTLRDVEFIFVDDASPDDSISIIRHITDEYPHRRVLFLTHKENKGLPAARNTGLEVASGDWIWHCDSDDWPEPTMLEDLYNAAIRSGADYAYCDYYLDFGTGCRYLSNPTYTDPEQMIKEGFLAGAMKYNVWNKLVKRTLYQTKEYIRFPDGHSMGEDMTMIPLAMLSRRTIHVPKALYHYSKSNKKSYSNSVSPRHMEDIRYNGNRTLGYLNAWEVEDRVQYAAFFKLSLKLPLLMTCRKADYLLWRNWYTEANDFIRINTILPRRTRLVQLWAESGHWLFVWLYAFAVNRLYYGLVISRIKSGS